MIISISFRHGTENKALRNRAAAECKTLQRFMPGVTRAEVVFYRQTHHRKYAELITCHISVKAAQKRSFNIYEHQANEVFAFDHALERIKLELAHTSPPQHIFINELGLRQG